MQSVGHRLRDHGGVGPGFDAVRLSLSLVILFWHSIATSYGHVGEAVVWDSAASAPLSSLLPMFFSLSGFLVMGSLNRTRDLGAFVGLRLLRIVPALSTEILVSAVVIGLMFSTLPLKAYLTDPLFLKYFGSLFGKVSYVLPGVFADNPDPTRVNVSLWTIAPEISCYLYLALHLSLRSSRAAITASTLLLLALNCAADLGGMNVEPGNGAVPSRGLLLSFAVGNMVYVWRDTLPFSPPLAVVGFVAGCVLVKVSVLASLSLPAFAYAIVTVGLCRIRLPFPFNSGDYSYGVYLYAYPIQQTFSHLCPGLRTFYWNIIVCTPLTLLVAACSWWFVEKPALRLRKVIYARLRPAELPSFGAMLLATMLLSMYTAFMLDSMSVLGQGARLRYLLPVAAALGLAVAAARVLHLRLSPGPLAGEAGPPEQLP